MVIPLACIFGGSKKVIQFWVIGVYWYALTQLTAYSNLPGRLHWRAVSIVRITGNLVHVSGDVMNNSHHVPGGILSD